MSKNALPSASFASDSVFEASGLQENSLRNKTGIQLATTGSCDRTTGIVHWTLRSPICIAVKRLLPCGQIAVRIVFSFGLS